MVFIMYIIRLVAFSLILVTPVEFSQASRVSELSDRIIEMQKEGQWFIMFYAPWCAFCKRLEPIWGHVAQALYKTNIRVGRVDCTRYTAVANEFKISGYPTIVFIKDGLQFPFKSDKTKDEMVTFALRLSGPPVQRITKHESLGNLMTVNKVFFVFVGSCEGPHWNVYYDVAEKFQPYGFFYCATHELVKKHVTVKGEGSIFVYKEKNFYFFEEDPASDHFNSSLQKWVNEERFLTFPKVTRGNLHQFYQLEKYLVLAVLEENKLEEISPEMVEFRDMVESVIISHRVRYHKRFQFGWIGSPDLANSIAMTILPLPHLIVVNSTTRHHHLPQDDPARLTRQALIMFLDQVHNQSAPVLGGNSFLTRLYSLYFEGKTSLSDMWRGNPVLTAFLLGLPFGFLTLICYSICCSDIMDADDDEEEEFVHEKKE